LAKIVREKETKIDVQPPTVNVQAPEVNVQPQIAIAAPDTKAFGEALKEMKQVYDNILMPLVVASYRKMKMDHSIWEDMKRVNDILKKMDLLLAAESVRETVKKKGGNAGEKMKN
ncbi:MAG: hypothetical protein LBO79_07075, partial [Zoogloeaceae bacterium]|nr:hypothetical protein [Zoogloeaceae bacterium]